LVKTIHKILDFFYPLFKGFFDKTTYYYAACGGVNTLFDLFLFFISYNFILKKQLVELPFIAVSPHIAAFIIAFFFSFPTGFLLMRYVVFRSSYLRGSVQLFRYFLSVCISLLLNYIFLKIFVEQFHFYPTVSKLIITFIVVGFSYLTQKYFSFKTDKNPDDVQLQ
jgi:putative flippase GtrA